MGVCCCDCNDNWEDPHHGMGTGLRDSRRADDVNRRISYDGL
jgi:hypothetical protein